MSPPAIGLKVPGASQRSATCENGTELRYWVAGTGPAVVCVNAHGQDLLVFSNLVERLSQSHRVVAWKPRGTFENDCAGHSLRDQMRDLERIVERERIERCSLITWCAGAKVAIEFARRNDRVRSLVLANGTFAKIPGLERLQTHFEQTLADLCDGVVQNPQLAGIVMRSMRSLLEGGALRGSTPPEGSVGTDDAALKALIVEPFQSVQTTMRYAAQVVDYLGHDISPALSELRVPALVISGEEDRVSSPAMGRAVAERVPLGRVMEIPSATHYWLHEDSALAAEVILGFLREERSGREPRSKRVISETREDRH